jgi:hypothetical protein
LKTPSFIAGDLIIRERICNNKLKLRFICGKKVIWTIDCEDGRWMELAQDRVQYIFKVLSLIVYYIYDVTATKTIFYNFIRISAFN